ncbi:hypothetical protein ABZ814_29025 [Micromonospora musae]|uniref:hypothetical protein n=1 Tax=Micromonospora musae TaxID=1894970 RepID=UPI0034009B95
MDSLSSGAEMLRSGYFRAVTGALPAPQRCDILLVTHLMPDRPSLLRAMSEMGEIRAVIPISHAVDARTRADLVAAGYAVHTATAAELLESGDLKKAALEILDSSTAPLIICEIGGYFAELLAELHAERPGRIAGVIEGTEAGHRRYLEAGPLPVPVLSIARSTLKETEVRLVGTSSVFSIERLLRERGMVCTGLNALVIGYGKVGSGAAEAARRRGFAVTVWDNDPARRVLALLDGFRVPGRTAALADAEVIIGATGLPSITSADLPALRDGALLVSTSSRDVEFGDLPAQAGERVGDISAISRTGRGDVYLVAGGTPVNFLHGAVLGHALDLIQSEMLAAITTLAAGAVDAGLGEVASVDRALLAQTWLDTIVRPDGSLRFMPSGQPSA